MEVPLLNKEGHEIGKIALKEEIFGVKPKVGVLQQAEVAYMAGLRSGTAKTKTKGEVSGGGRKPWKQKGTGRARQGSIRAPQWRGGGISFGPQPRSYQQGTPKKLKKLAILGALAEKARGKSVFILDKLEFDKIKTKEVVQAFKKLNLKGNILLVLEKYERNIFKSCNNIPTIKVELAKNLNIHTILVCDQIVTTKETFSHLEELLCQN